MKKITITILGIFLIANVSGMYAGENMTFELTLENPIYTVVNNNSNLEGLNVTYENGNITISTVQNYKPDNFTLIFFSNTTNEVIKTVSVGGGHSTKIEYVNKNVTTYVPEYINKTLEVEKIVPVDNTTILETGYELWHLFLIGLICLLFGGWIVKDWKKKND